MKVLLAGLGSIGQRHARNWRRLYPQDTLIAFRTQHTPLPDDLVNQFQVFSNLNLALEQKPALAFICNPTAFHLEIAIEAARSGCHVFLEKPVSHTLDGLTQLSELLRQNSKMAWVGYQFRFHPQLQKLKQWIDEGHLGTVYAIEASAGEFLPGWHPWEDYRRSYTAQRALGGGSTLTYSHEIDGLLWLGGTATRVMGCERHSGQLDMDVEDTTDAWIDFATGVQGRLHVDLLQKPARRLYTVTGSRGTAIWHYDQGTLSWQGTEGTRSWTKLEPGFERNQMYLEELKNVRAGIEQQTSPVCGLPEGQAALNVALAIKASHRLGHAIDL